MALAASGGGFTFSLASVGGTWRWTVVASSLNAPVQNYQVQDIVTPYGAFGVVNSPLPADVVGAMAQSITDVRDQIKPHLALVSSTTSFSLGITEGDARCSAGSVQVRNNGAFGSFISLAATADVPWLAVLTPATIGVGKGEIATFSFDVVPDSMLASGSPYVGHIRIQDLNDSGSYVLATVTVLVLPRPVIQVNTQTVSMTWSVSAPTPVVSNLVIANNGPGTSSLSCTASKVSNVPWLTVTPAAAGPLASGATATLAMSIVAAAVPPVLGDYIETIRIASPNASNSPVDVRVTLTVGP